jgi:hypothetical protein
MWRLRRKTERGWNDGFHINTKAEAEGLCELLNKLERELTEALSDLEFRRDLFKLQEQQLNDVRAERDRLAEQKEANHKVTIAIGRMFFETKEQRDRLAYALFICRKELVDVLDDINKERVSYDGDDFHEALRISKDALEAVKGGSDE